MKFSSLQVTFLIVTLLLQVAVAYSSDCMTQSEASLSETHMSMTDHGNHDMQMDSDAMNEHNCCAESCECLIFSCQLAFSVSKNAFDTLHIKSLLTNLSPESISLGIFTSIYRPPIFA